MNKTSNYYRDTPVGQQLGVFYEDRATLRRTISLFPSLSAMFGNAKSRAQAAKSAKAKVDRGHHSGHHTVHHA
ncbi:hypothetical protein H0A71_08410 [Alcaligenaceae bacterium]|nr:hypothetical protein [Alcaligenaceae bacterium]